MLELSERDEVFFEMVVKFKMVLYEMVREVYRNKKVIYNRIGKMIDEGVLKKVGWNNIIFIDSGVKLIEEVYGLKFELLSNLIMFEMVGRWKNVVWVGFRKYIMLYFIICWELKSELRKQQGQQGKKEISDKNKVFGVVKGYVIFKVFQKVSMKVLFEMIDDINEFVEYDIYRFIILCEGEKLKDFLQVVLKYSIRLRVQVLYILLFFELGLQIMDVIIGILEWKYRVVIVVYGNMFFSRYKVFDFEFGGKLIYIGIDGEMISKNIVENVLKLSLYMRVEILCLKGQEWWFEGILVGLKIIILQEFLNVVGYELIFGSQFGS